MGVQGLTSLLDTDRRIYRELELRRKRLLVDGSNLLFPLYLTGLDQNHGGDYAAFEEEIEKFVSALRLCEIEPYVVMDGGADATNNKLETMKQRAEDNIRKCHQAAVEGTEQGVLPLCSRMVFVQTLERLKVPLAQCYGEADQQIAALASEWQCLVLSNDSDFFIFSLPAGLLPIRHFQWKSLELSGSRWYIPCKSYHTSHLCSSFNIGSQLLPTFAVLAKVGSIRWADSDPTREGGPNRLRGLLSWLSSFLTPQAGLEAALGLMENLSSQRKEEVLQNLTLEMEMYQLPPSSLESFFIHGITPVIPAVGEELQVVKRQCPVLPEVGVRVPDWMRRPLMQAHLSGDILNVLQLHRKGLSMPVDHGDMPSAALTSRPLRQLLYGLLLGRDTRLLVEEWDRDGLKLDPILVEPEVTSVTRRLELRSLNKGRLHLRWERDCAVLSDSVSQEIYGGATKLALGRVYNQAMLVEPLEKCWEVELSQRLQVILQALKVKEASLRSLPPQLRLPVAVTCFWLQNAEPAPDETLLKSLLLGLSDGDALRHAAVLQPENPHQEPKLDLDVAHALNQWQMCLKDSVGLNRLLSCPLPDQHIARLYEGTLVHRLVHRMRTIGGLRDFLKKDLYQSMLSVVQRSQEALRKTEERRTALRWKPLDNLQQLSVQYEDQQAEMKSFIRAQDDPSLDYLSPDDPSLDHLSPDDPSLDHVLMLKTRFKTKERNNRCKNPELNRKEESRGGGLL
ncbi:protein asteroid homolog 1-like [Platichthys flesus]|uniref:protein asteroid homolog 1-like n=1 Tax=Platichthys flesus TaxID=8260 RepID=UPI002DBEAEAC|nr:protein asteroid homolog 1-like [Platichthys flesus]